MILGIGSDLIDIRRMERVIARFGERFLDRVFTPTERAKSEGRKNRIESYAKRFAAKEAFSKAVGRGIRYPVNWQNVGVENERSGKPVLRFSPALDAWLKERGITAVHLSLTDETNLAAAYVIIEGEKT